MVRDWYIVAPWARRVLSVHRLGYFVSVSSTHTKTTIWDRDGWCEAIDWEGRRDEFGIDVDRVGTQKGLPVDLESVEGGQLAHAEWLDRNGERGDRGETVEEVLEGRWVGWRRLRLWMDLFDEGDCMMFGPNAATRVSDLYRPYHGGPGKPPLKDGWLEDDVFAVDESNRMEVPTSVSLDRLVGPRDIDGVEVGDVVHETTLDNMVTWRSEVHSVEGETVHLDWYCDEED